MLAEQMKEAWEVNNRANLMLLEAIPAAGMEATMNPRGRTVAQQMAHLHSARVMWLEVSSPELAKGLKKFGKDDSCTKAEIKNALTASGKAIGDLLEKAGEKGKVKNFKRGAVTFLSYLVAHEGHHRGQVILHLKLSGNAIDKETGFGIWEWGKI